MSLIPIPAEVKDILGVALPAVTSLVFGPLMTLVAKKISAAAGNTMGAKSKLIITSIAGALAALAVGDVNGLADAIGNLILGGIGGLGGSKARDIKVGKPYSSPTEMAGETKPAPVG